MGIKGRLFRYYFPEALAGSAIRRVPASCGVVLVYHEVLPDDSGPPAWVNVRESDFLWQMKYLKMYFDVVSMDQALERSLMGKCGQKPFAVVTFDDGYKGNLHTVLPFMESMGLPFIVYVATEAVTEGKLLWHDRILGRLSGKKSVVVRLDGGGKRGKLKIAFGGSESSRWEKVQRLLTCLKEMGPVEREKAVKDMLGEHNGTEPDIKMLNSEDLQKLARSNCVTLGCHTHGHELLHRLEPREIVETLNTANEHLAAITGRAPRHFAYPNGDFNESVVEQVREMGYKTAVTTRPGYWTSNSDLHQIPRIGIGRFETVGQFKARLSGYL